MRGGGDEEDAGGVSGGDGGGALECEQATVGEGGELGEPVVCGADGEG